MRELEGKETAMLTCQICGRAPATQLTLRRHVGMLVLQKFYKAKPTLCREHGAAAAKEWLGKTAVQGWWGIISFFVNFVAVITDVVALSRAKKLDEPRTVSAEASVSGGQTEGQAPTQGGFSA